MTTLSKMARLAVVFVYSVVFCVTLIYGGKASILMAVALISIPFSLIKPSSFFLFFMVARPLADMSAETSVLGLNPASWVTVVFILFCVKEFLAGDPKESAQGDALLQNFNRYFAVLLFAFLPSFLQTDDMRISLMDMIRLISSGIAVNYLLRKFYRREEDINLYCRAAMFSAVIPVGLGLRQWIFDAGAHTEGFNRVYGTFTHPNVFAEYLLFIFFVTLYSARFLSAGFFKKTAHYLFMGVILFSIYKTYTRSIWIAFAACIVMYALIQKKAAVKIGSLLVVACLALAALPFVQTRFSDITGASGEGRKSSLEWRLSLWRQTAGEIKDHPFFGNGLGMYEHKVGVMAHNDILRMAYETGLVATFVYLTGFLILIIYAFRELKRPGQEDARDGRLQIGLCLLVGFLVSSLADNMLRSTVILFFYFTAAMLFLSKRREAEAA